MTWVLWCSRLDFGSNLPGFELEVHLTRRDYAFGRAYDGEGRGNSRPENASAAGWLRRSAARIPSESGATSILARRP